MGSDKIYIAIDLKSFYASVEAVDLGLDPLTANLVVADPSCKSYFRYTNAGSPSSPTGTSTVPWISGRA